MPDLLLASDLHINQTTTSIEDIVGDVSRDLAIFLGDFSPTYDTTDLERFIRHHLQFSDILYVLGNHEFYSHDFYKTPNVVYDLFAHINQTTEHQVQLLHNTTTVHSGIRFIGTPLWSEFDLSDPDVYAQLLRRTTQYNITPEALLEEYFFCKQFLEDALATQTIEPTIVLTHYAPSFSSIAEKFKVSKTNSMYCSDLDHLMEQHKPMYWLHGHTHSQLTYKKHRTNVLCHAHGYASIAGEVDAFHPDFIITI